MEAERLLNLIAKPLRWMRQTILHLREMVLKRLPAARATHNNWTAATAYLFMGGMLFFLTLKVVPNDYVTYKAYYLWDKGKDCLLLFCLLLLCEPLRRFLFVFLVYSLIRFLWQILVTITGEDINDIRWINVIWLILVIYMVTISIKEMINRNDR